MTSPVNSAKHVKRRLKIYPSQTTPKNAAEEGIQLNSFMRITSSEMKQERSHKKKITSYYH